MQTLWQDVRYGIRMLLKKPGVTVAAIFMLALGIGATTAIFSVVNTMLLNPLPYPSADRLVRVSLDSRTGASTTTNYATYLDWKARSQSVEEIAALRDSSGVLIGQGEPEMISAIRVSANYFQTLGVRPLMGRDFRPEDDRPDGRFVVILSYGLWQRRFGSDPDIIGKGVQFTGREFTVIGVMPQNFEDLVAVNFYDGTQLWSPIGYDPAAPWACRTCNHLRAIARLKPDVTLAQFQSEMKAISESLATEYPTDYAVAAVTIKSLQDVFVSSLRPLLYILLGAVGFVLLIACANVANLLLARATQRQREMAIRAALGARRGRIIRQLLTESLVLALSGAGLGLLLASWGTELLTRMSPAKMLQVQQVTMDGRVLLFTMIVAIFTGLLFGLAPALQASQLNVESVLRETERGLLSPSQRRIRGALVVAEIALALVLLVGAGLLIKSFLRLLEVKPGFETENVLTLKAPAFGRQFEDEAAVRAFYRDALGRIQALPGVEAVGLVSNLPLGGNRDKYGFHIEGRPLANPAEAPNAERYSITPDYLRTMRIPLLRGRIFTEQDTEETPLVALINQTAAERIWPNENPIGKRIRLGGPDNPLRTIVGIVGNVQHEGLDTPPDMQTYVPHAQWSDGLAQLVIRTSGEPQAILDDVRREIWAVNSTVPIYEIATLEQLVSASVKGQRFAFVLLAIFAFVALLMAAVGIYSVMSYTVTQRTQEIGIRMALGANTKDVMKIILLQGLRLAGLGVGLGIVAAFALTRLMASLLFSVSATDPLIFVAVILAIIAVASLSGYLPARRAAKTDPMIALRYE